MYLAALPTAPKLPMMSMSSQVELSTKSPNVMAGKNLQRSQLVGVPPGVDPRASAFWPLDCCPRRVGECPRIRVVYFKSRRT
jgi:hypothetical protein